MEETAPPPWLYDTTLDQAVLPDVQQEPVVYTSADHDEMEEDVANFLEFTRTDSAEVAEEYLTTKGSLKEALRSFRKDQKALRAAKRQSPAPVMKPVPLTLLEEALKAYSESSKPKKKERQFRGDTIVILDGKDFSRHCRLNSSDLCYASQTFKAEPQALPGDEEPIEVHGVRRLYILLQSGPGGMPKLMRKSLLTMKEDCAGEIYTNDQELVITGARTKETAGNLGKQPQPTRSKTPSIKKENSLAEEQQRPVPLPLVAIVDWRSEYEDFFCLVTRFKPKFCEAQEPDSILHRLKTIAEIANYYDAVRLSSPITTILTDLFNRYRVENQLWEAVAEDAASWLLVAIELKNASIFREAYVHVAGCYPEWPWSRGQADVPKAVMESIEIKSSILHDQRMKVERQLLLTTLGGHPAGDRTVDLPVSQTIKPVTYNVVNIWRDWIANHLAFLDKGPGATAIPTELCKHPEHSDCLNVAGFYRRVNEGGGAYLPPAQVKNNWDASYQFKSKAPGYGQRWDEWDGVRADLKTLKDEASTLVAPLAKVNLQYTAKLEYLTCIEVEEDDLPWEKEVKGESDGEDELMG